MNDSSRLSLIADITYYQTDPDSIIYYAEYLRKEASDVCNILFLAKACYYKGCALKLLSQNDNAIKYQFECIKYAKSINNEFLVALANLEIGYIYNSLGNSSEAIVFFHNGIDKLKLLNNSPALAGAYLNLATEYFAQGNLDSSYAYYQLSDKEYILIGDRIGKSYVLGNIGIVLVKMDRLDSARIKLKEACDLLQKENAVSIVITFKLWLSTIENKSRNFSQSLKYVNEAFQVASQNGLKDQIRNSYEQFSNVYTAMGRYQEANEALKNYYAYRDSIINTETITKIANLRTDFEVGQKQAELDVVRAQDSFKTKVAWFLAAVLLGAVVFVYVHYRQYRYNQRLTVLLKRQNHDRQQQKIALEAAVAAKDRLFSVIAHDLRGPIGAMGNLVILANDAMVNNEWGDLQSILIMMGDSNREVENLLNSLLHWSIGQRGTYTTKVEAVDFSRLVQSVIDVYLPIAFAKGVHISFVPQYEEHLIETDLNSWAVIVRNLVNNAVKFTHLGGVVTVTAQQYPDYLALKVSDTGIGMDPHLAQNVFSSSVNQSQWGTASEKGLGIGLSLVKDFVEMNDGQIQVESQLGQGTTFTVTIPVNVLKATPFVSEMV